jgi:KUP system potassium uptake protein
MTTWHRGQEVLSRSLFEKGQALETFMHKIEQEKPQRISGTSLFLTRHQNIAPGLLLYQYRINRVLSEKVILLSISFARTPYTQSAEHGKVTDLGNGFYQVVSEYGFMERPKMDDILGVYQRTHSEVDLKHSNFYIGRDLILPTGHSGMARWRKKLYAFVLLNSQRPAEVLKINPDLVVEIGRPIEI